MKTLLQDLRYGLRMLWKTPGFTLVAVVSLALGIGLNTAIFSIVNVILIRPVPMVKEQGSVVWLRAPISYPDYVDYREQTQSFEGMAAATGTSEFSLARGGEPELIKGEYVTENYFDVLKVGALSGRTFLKGGGADADARCRLERAPLAHALRFGPKHHRPADFSKRTRLHGSWSRSQKFYRHRSWPQPRAVGAAFHAAGAQSARGLQISGPFIEQIQGAGQPLAGGLCAPEAWRLA